MPIRINIDTSNRYLRGPSMPSPQPTWASTWLQILGMNPIFPVTRKQRQHANTFSGSLLRSLSKRSSYEEELLCTCDVSKYGMAALLNMSGALVSYLSPSKMTKSTWSLVYHTERARCLQQSIVDSRTLQEIQCTLPGCAHRCPRKP
jgi:hypothetical protein